jgi:transcriptional regulator with XRE-family HTH domain
MHSANPLKELRVKNGLTQHKVADYLHVDRSTYAYYESGHTKINVDVMIQLAHLFQVDLYTFLNERQRRAALGAGAEEAGSADGAGNAFFEGAAARFSQLSMEERKLVILCRSGSPAQRGAMLAHAESLLPAKAGQG